MNGLNEIMHIAMYQVTPNLNGLKEPFYYIAWFFK